MEVSIKELKENVNYLESKNKEQVIDRIANFGAWLVDNHECRFMGGEIEIAELCSEYIEQLHTIKKEDKR